MKKLTLLRSLKPLVASLAFAMCLPVAAANVNMQTSTAEGWVLENYAGGPVVIWFTGAVCENRSQNISMTNPTAGEVNRLWSTVMSAKMSNAKIFIWYDNKNCNIVSFGFV